SYPWLPIPEPGTWTRPCRGPGQVLASPGRSGCGEPAVLSRAVAPGTGQRCGGQAPELGVGRRRPAAALQGQRQMEASLVAVGAVRLHGEQGPEIGGGALEVAAVPGQQSPVEGRMDRGGGQRALPQDP